MSETDTLYMQRCIELAQLSRGKNRPNPEVGSLIVHNNKIIGEGWHAVYGSAHAEVNAINSVIDKSLLKESTIYVTLEPCFHFGKTAPCVDLILKHKIPKVVIGCKDPYHEVAGRSIEKLRNAGVDVSVGILEKEVAWLTRRFFTNVEKKRPYIVLKYAITKDGFIGKLGQNVQISSSISRRYVHQLRASEAAIMVGTETANCDNPQLNLRFYFGQEPIRIVLDRKLRLDENLHLFDGKQKTIVFTESQNYSILDNVEFIMVDFQSVNFLPTLLQELYTRKICSVLIEGGAKLLSAFIKENLWDEAYLLRSKSVNLTAGIEAPNLKQSYLSHQEVLSTDCIEHYINTDRK